MLTLLCVGADELSADPPNRAKLNGAYAMTVMGDYSGDGQAVVAAKAVHIDLRLVSDQEGEVRLKQNNMPLDDGNFQGELTIGGVVYKIFGRVSAADGTIVAGPRVSCLITTSDNRIARAVGQRKSD